MLNVVSSKARGEASMSAKNGSIKLVAGNSNPALAKEIAGWLGLSLTKAIVRRFADMEIFVEIQENVRGSDVFIIHSTSFPANDHLMELLIIIAAPGVAPPHHCRRALLRLRPSGPQGRTAHADFRQAGGEPDHPCRRRPRHDARSARRTNPGLLRHSDRQSLRLAGHGA